MSSPNLLSAGGVENLYIHLPFCRSKCGYCGFYSEAGRDELIDRYLDKLIWELNTYDVGERVETLYVGGGTPTLLSLRQLERLLEELPEAAESTIEANPETLTKEKVALLSGKFSRISIGIQSFDYRKRQLLGRNCSDAAIMEALELVAESGIKHRNCDLIYGVGAETATEFELELSRVLMFPVDHLSCYALTREENAMLQSAAQLAGHDEREADIAVMIKEYLCGIMPRYEISNYAKAGGKCLHNLNIWRGRSYLGLGASAGSFVAGRRFTAAGNIDSYISNAAAEYDNLSIIERAAEVFVMNLRTVAGWSRVDWEHCAIESPPSWQIMKLAAERVQANYWNFWEITSEQIKLTESGLDFWDSMAVEFMEELER